MPSAFRGDWLLRPRDPVDSVSAPVRSPSRSRLFLGCATAAIVVLHLGLMVAELPRAFGLVPDSGYHVSLARQYAERGTLFWDPINYGPGGRPNLQGPLLHASIGALGLVLGGEGDDYVTANTVLCLLLWICAMGTAIFFGRRFAGDWGGLFALAILSGSAIASGLFSSGIPAGWVFVFAPWAVHFFLRERLLLAVLATSASIYVHLGGFVTAPAALFVAAWLTGRWRNLWLVGAATALLTSPYFVHVVRHLDWYRGLGANEHMPMLVDPLNHLLAAGGLVWLLRRGRSARGFPFLLAWFAAPLPWLVYDPKRVLFQSVLAGSVLGACFLADLIARTPSPRRRIGLAVSAVALATILPLGPPALLPQISFVTEARFPTLFDFDDARGVARVIEEAGLGDRLLSHYGWGGASAIAIFAPVQIEKGHWVEVHPWPDPADWVPAGEKAYALFMPPDDPVLRDLVARGLYANHGGSASTAVVTLTRPASLDVLAPLAEGVVAREATWLSENATHNGLEKPLRLLFTSREGLARHRRDIAEQAARISRIQAVVLAYAHALEGVHDELAWEFRHLSRLYAQLGMVIGHEASLEITDARRHQRIRSDFAWLARIAPRLADPTRDPESLVGELRRFRASYRWLVPLSLNTARAAAMKRDAS